MTDDELKALADLLACPWCGGEKSEVVSFARSGRDIIAYVVWCTTPDSHGGRCYANGPVAATEAEAIDAWNAREATCKEILQVRDNLPAIIEQRAEIERLREAMVLCQEQFQFYANEHRAAGKIEKAATNQKYADIACAALNPTGQPA